MTNTKDYIRTGWIGAAITSALPGILLAGVLSILATKPKITLCPYQNAVCVSYSNENRPRHFTGNKTSGKLEEVVLATNEDKVITLHPGSKGFIEQEEIYKTEVLPYIQKLFAKRQQ